MINPQFSPAIKVWYKPLPRVTKTLWPILDVGLSIKDISLPQPVLSLVDSGASSSILHPDLAGALGFDRKTLGKYNVVGSSASGAYKGWVLKDAIKANVYGYEFDIKFTIIDNPGLVWPCILGEDSIFQLARIDFQKFKGFFEVRFRTDIN